MVYVRGMTTKMSLGTRFYTMMHGELVGKDQWGNKYYRRKFKKLRHNMLKEQRWVIYNGMVEASKVPAEWFRWIHHTTDELPPKNPKRHAWQKPYLPNLTGTPYTYRPVGSLLKEGERPPALGDYQAWNPKKLEHFDES